MIFGLEPLTYQSEAFNPEEGDSRSFFTQPDPEGIDAVSALHYVCNLIFATHKVLSPIRE